jgi:hypothetical protein
VIFNAPVLKSSSKVGGAILEKGERSSRLTVLQSVSRHSAKAI